MKRTTFFGLLFTLLSAGAFAQSTGSVSTDSEAIDEVRDNARIHSGPLYMTPRILLKQLGVDDNVFYTAEDPKSDFTFTVAPTMNVAIPVAHKALFTVAGAADLVYFQKYDSERSIDPEVMGRAETYLNHLTLYVEDSYISSRQRPNYEIDLRSRRKDNLASAGLIWHFTPKFSVEGNGRRRTLRYDADAFFDGSSLRDTLNHDSTGVTITPRFNLTPLTSLGVRLERLQERFEYSAERNNDTTRWMPGVEFKPRALISGIAYVGHRELAPRDETALPPFSGLVANLALSYTLLQKTTFAVTYDRDLQYSIEEFQPDYVSDSLGASIRHALGSHFDVMGTAGRYRYEFRQLNVSPTTLAAERIDRIQVYSGTFGYRIGQAGRLGVGAWYTDRQSTRADRTFDSLRFGTTMTYGF
jgi:Putative beta-barrel porin 2